MEEKREEGGRLILGIEFSKGRLKGTEIQLGVHIDETRFILFNLSGLVSKLDHL